MESRYHSEWQNNRIQFIVDLYGQEFFKNKKVLELAPFNGYIGYKFNQFGADVSCVEGRQENVNFIKNTYPMIKAEQGDLDTPEWKWGKWDIIINFGLYYHLQNYHREHLINCINNSDIMFFETVVFDSSEPEIHFRNEGGDDQSLTNVGGNPSTSYIENIFKELNVSYEKYCSPKLNGGGHHYDWPDKNSKILDPVARRFWIVKK